MMIETAAWAVVLAYLAVGAFARVFVPVATTVDINDELISIMIWLGATIVAGIGVVVLGANPLGVVLAAGS